MNKRDERGTLSAKLLRSLLHYEPETGEFTRLANSSWAKAGDKADSVGSKGYIEFNLLGKLWRANRLAWLYMTGEWPVGIVDHKDGDKANNRWGNLRDVSNRVNCENRRGPNSNNRTGLLGVSFHKKTGKYQSRIKANGNLIYLGLYADPQHAHAVYVSAKRQLHEGSTL